MDAAAADEAAEDLGRVVVVRVVAVLLGRWDAADGTAVDAAAADEAAEDLGRVVVVRVAVNASHLQGRKEDRKEECQGKA